MTKKYASGSGGGGSVKNAKDSLFSGDAIEVVLGIAEGPIEGIKGATVAEQLHHVYLDGTPILSQTGTKNFLDSQIILSYERGTPVTIDEDTEFGQTPIPYILGGNATPINVGASLDYNIPVSRTVPAGYRNQYKKIEIRLLVSRHVEFTDKGSKEIQTQIVIRYKKSSSTTWTTKYHTIQGKTVSGGYISSYNIYLSDTSEDYDLEVKMANINDPEKTAREIAWLAYELSNPLKDTNGVVRRELHPGTAMVSFVAKVGENFSNLPNFTAVWRGLLCSIPSNYDPETRLYDETVPWDGSFKAGKYWTNNPFWIARELILNPRFGMARYNPSVSIDDFSVYEEAKYADTFRVTPDGRTIPLFTFNGLITQPMQGLELINYILGSANAQALEYASGHLRVVSDRNTPAVMTVVPEMCVQLQDDVIFTYSATDLKDRFNEINVSYIEPKMEWQPQFIGPFIDAQAQEQQGVNVYEFEAIGCTEVAECEYKAYFKLISAQTETFTVTFNIPAYAMDWDIYDIIDIVDPTMDWGLSGRALNVLGTAVVLRDPLYFEEVGTYEFHLQTLENGKVIRSFTIASPGSYRNLTLDLAVLEPLAQYPAFSIMREGANPGRAKPFRVVSIKPLEGSPNIFSITAIEVNRNKWQQALDLEIGEKPYYNFEKPRRPETPTNLRFVSSLVVPRNGQSQNLVSLTWDGSDTGYLGLTYTLQASIDGAAFIDLGDTRLKFYEAEVEGGKTYTFRVRLNYNDIQLFSNTIAYSVPEYVSSDFDLSRLTFDVTGGYYGDDIKLQITANYKYPDTEQVVDLITAGKVKGVVLDFFTREGDVFTFLLTKIVGERNVTLTAQEQFAVNDKLGTEIRCDARLIDFNDQMFPSAAVVASINVYALPIVTGIVTTATSRTISAEIISPHPVKRNGGVRWYLSETAAGLDKKLIAETAGLYAYTVNKPETDFYLWAQPWSNYGVGTLFPSGNGIKVTTLPLDDFESNEPTLEEIQALLSGQINESYLATVLRSRIDLIDLTNGGGLLAGQEALREDLDAYNQTLTSQGSAIAQLQNVDTTQATQINALGTRTADAESQILTLQQTKADSATVTTQISTAKGEAIAIAEDNARTYTDTKTGQITAERTIKVQADGRVAGIGLIAGATSGSAIYFTADKIAILPPSANNVLGARLPFIYDAATGAIMMDTTFIRDLTASKISGGVLNLNQGNIRNLTVFDSFSPPDQFLQKAHFSDALARELAWIDPNAVATGGTVSKSVSPSIATTAMGSFLSGGQAPSIKVSGAAPTYQMTYAPNGYIDVQVLRNGVAVTVDGKTTFRILVSSALATDEALPAEQRRYLALCSGGVEGVAAAVASNTTTSWSIKVVASSGLGANAADFVIKATAFEAFGTSGGLIANTTWDAIQDKPATATRWPSWSEITGTPTLGDVVRAGSIHQAGMGASSTANEYIFGGFANTTTNSYECYIRMGGDKLQYWTGGVNHNIHHSGSRNQSGKGFDCGSVSPNSFDNSFEVYSASGGVRYGMMLWNTNGTSGEWATMLYGPNQAGRRISFGKVNTTAPTNFSHVSEVAFVDLDDGSFYAAGLVKGSRLYAGWDSGVEGSVSCSGWFRSTGNSGWYNTTHGAGIYSADSGVVRTYQTNRFEVYSTASNAIDVAGGITLGNGVTSNNSGSSWISQKDASNIPLDSYVSTSTVGGTYAAVVRQRHTDITFTVGGLSRSRFGFFSYLNSRSANGTDGSFYMDVYGNCVASGTITGADQIYSSDGRLKRDQTPIGFALNKVHQLTGKTYYRTDIQKYSAGVIAQDVKRVLPEAVTQDEKGYLAVSPGALIGLLVEAVKELSAKMQQLEAVR